MAREAASIEFERRDELPADWVRRIVHREGLGGLAVLQQATSRPPAACNGSAHSAAAQRQQAGSHWARNPAADQSYVPAAIICSTPGAKRTSVEFEHTHLLAAGRPQRPPGSAAQCRPSSAPMASCTLSGAAT